MEVSREEKCRVVAEAMGYSLELMNEHAGLWRLIAQDGTPGGTLYGGNTSAAYPDIFTDPAALMAAEEWLEREHDVCILSRNAPDLDMWYGWANLIPNPDIYTKPRRFPTRHEARAEAVYAAVMAM